MNSEDLKDFTIHISRYDTGTLDKMLPLLLSESKRSPHFIDEEVAEALVYFFDVYQNSRTPKPRPDEVKKRMDRLQALHYSSRQIVIQLLRSIETRFRNPIFEDDLISAISFWEKDIGE